MSIINEHTQLRHTNTQYGYAMETFFLIYLIIGYVGATIGAILKGNQPFVLIYVCYAISLIGFIWAGK